MLKLFIEPNKTTLIIRPLSVNSHKFHSIIETTFYIHSHYDTLSTHSSAAPYSLSFNDCIFGVFFP